MLVAKMVTANMLTKEILDNGDEGIVGMERMEEVGGGDNGGRDGDDGGMVDMEEL